MKSNTVIFINIFLLFVLCVILAGRVGENSQEIKSLKAEIQAIKSPKTFLLPDEVIENPGREN